MDGVGDQRASQPVKRAMIFCGAFGGQHAVFLIKCDAMWHGHREFPLGSLHIDSSALQRDLYPAGHWNWFVSDT
jgi:hypothetical protein